MEELEDRTFVQVKKVQLWIGFGSGLEQPLRLEEKNCITERFMGRKATHSNVIDFVTLHPSKNFLLGEKS